MTATQMSPEQEAQLARCVEAHEGFLAAERAYQDAQVHRADVFRRAAESGVRDARIAERIGVSRGRIGQIKKG